MSYAERHVKYFGKVALDYLDDNIGGFRNNGLWSEYTNALTVAYQLSEINFMGDTILSPVVQGLYDRLRVLIQRLYGGNVYGCLEHTVNSDLGVDAEPGEDTCPSSTEEDDEGDDEGDD